MPDDEPILLEVRDHALVITLHRPHVLNAHNQALRDHLVDALDRLDTDDHLRVGVIRGAGRAFSAGADLKEVAARPQGGRPDVDQVAMLRHFVRLDATRKPLIAVVHGWTVGGGLELALCCDLRVAAADTRFALPEPRSIGTAPRVAVHRLARMIPTGEALRLLLTSEPIDAARAHAIGLVQEVEADADAAFETAMRLAAEIAAGDPLAVATAKQVAKWHLTADIAASERFADALGWPDAQSHGAPPAP